MQLERNNLTKYKQIIILIKYRNTYVIININIFWMMDNTIVSNSKDARI